ncbi:MAG: efflux RND transporter periplasmic adaptor subunit [Bacillota bacterium]
MLKSRKRLISLMLAAAVFTAGCGFLDKENTEKEIEKSAAVETMAPLRRDIVSKVILNGKIKPVKEVIIVPKLPGKAASVLVDVGQRVKKGDVLFTLDEKDVRLQVAQAEAAVNVARSSLIRTKSSASEQQLEQLKLALKGAEAAYDSSKAAYEKTKEMYNAGAVQKDVLDKAEAQLTAAEQQYTAAKNNLDLVQNKSIPEAIAIAEAQYKQAEAAYNTAKNQLENLSIKSPIEGIVASRSIDEGEMVSNAAAAMIIVDLTDVFVDVNVTESIINKIKKGDSVKVLIPSMDNQSFDGEIMNISPSADIRLQSYPVRIKIANGQQSIKGGMFAEVEFIFDKIDNALVIPINSVIDEEGKRSVFIVSGDIAVKKEIITGLQDDEYIEVISGINGNDQLVVKGQDFLQDGEKVRITKNENSK